MDDRKPLYVRLPAKTAKKLDRAAVELGISKQDLVTNLVERRMSQSAGRRVVVESFDDTMTVGQHSFVPADAPDVLTLAEAAALLRVDEDAVKALAESGELPARRVGDEWRFARSAVVRWLEG